MNYHALTVRPADAAVEPTTGTRANPPSPNRLLSFSSENSRRPKGARDVTDFRGIVTANFADAAHGKRLTFDTGGSDGTEVVVRELLYATKREIFIFLHELPTRWFSAQVLRNIVAQTAAPRIRILLDSVSLRPESELSRMADIISPAGPIELRWSLVNSPVHYIVVDRKHVLLDDAEDSPHQILDMNATIAAERILARLEKLWGSARPVHFRCQSITREFAL